ncbi:MAG: polymer-forming cytoskeletal protein [Bacteroidales bacterium]|jgi:cytoskeletal protein CcmA (bactofilin family)|nr:polymer-forming cytoskeletal protein [Bacteroidales bacterium]
MEPNISVNEVSRISAGSVFKGEISSPNDIRIDGTFEGKVFSKGRVVVGEKAVVKGDIICQNVDFWGVIEGNFYVKDTLSLKGGCKVDGDLHIKRLQVELDARFNGNCRMIAEGEFDKLAAQLTGQPMPRPAAPQQPQSQQAK